MASADHPSNRVTVLEALRTVTFPATREELIEHAREQGADEMALDELAGLPADRYESAADLAPLLGPVPASGAGSGPRGLSEAGDDLGEHPSMLSPPD